MAGGGARGGDGGRGAQRSGHIGRRRLTRRTVFDVHSNSTPSSLQSDVKEVKMDQ